MARVIGAALRARGGRLIQQSELVCRRDKNSAPRPALLRLRCLSAGPCRSSCQPELDWPGFHELALLSVPWSPYRCLGGRGRGAKGKEPMAGNGRLKCFERKSRLSLVESATTWICAEDHRAARELRINRQYLRRAP